MTKSAQALLTRRAMLLGSASLALAGCATESPLDEGRLQAARQVLAGATTVDMHSHAGGILHPGHGGAPVATPMRQGGMAVICLAMVADLPLLRVSSDGNVGAARTPASDELYGWSRIGFQRINDLIKRDGLGVVLDRAGLARASADAPSVIVAAEGADFLDGHIERVEQTYTRWRLRHLQLTHYRVNTLGDIQTEPPEHDGLTPFGADVIRECNRLGIVIDVAHATGALVRRAVEVTTKPIVLSHTSITAVPGPRSRQVSAAHAKLVADTGGVVGVWPNRGIYGTTSSWATGVARMVDAIGVDHVGLGSDMEGLTRGSVFDGYADLPRLADALLARGFTSDEVRRILGANYARVFAATVRA